MVLSSNHCHWIRTVNLFCQQTKWSSITFFLSVWKGGKFILPTDKTTYCIYVWKTRIPKHWFHLVYLCMCFPVLHQKFYHNSCFLLSHCSVKSLDQQIPSIGYVAPCCDVEKLIEETNPYFPHSVQIGWTLNVPRFIFLLWLLHGQAHDVYIYIYIIRSLNKFNLHLISCVRQEALDSYVQINELFCQSPLNFISAENFYCSCKSRSNLLQWTKHPSLAENETCILLLINQCHIPYTVANCVI